MRKLIINCLSADARPRFHLLRRSDGPPRPFPSPTPAAPSSCPPMKRKKKKETRQANGGWVAYETPHRLIAVGLSRGRDTSGKKEEKIPKASTGGGGASRGMTAIRCRSRGDRKRKQKQKEGGGGGSAISGLALFPAPPLLISSVGREEGGGGMTTGTQRLLESPVVASQLACIAFSTYQSTGNLLESWRRVRRGHL